MDIRYFFIAALWMTTLSVSAQSNVNKSYHRMEGNIGDNIEVTANFIRLFDKVDGNYQYRFKDNDASMFYGKMLELEGRLLKNDSLYLKEYGADDYSFKGIWGSNSFKGDWKEPGDGENYMEVLLKEYYPSGSLPFDVFYLSSEVQLTDDIKDSPSASLELTFVYPKINFIEQNLLDSVRHIITTGFFGDNFVATTPEKMMTSFEKEYYSNYKNSNLDLFKETKGASFSWASMNNMSVVFNSNYLLCVEYQKYAYTGGAHGMTNISYDIIDLKKGKTLTYNDIFVDSADSALAAILTMKMLMKYKTKKESSLKKVGFFVDSITPNQNVYVTGNGIGFKYASYELAPYSYGLPEVFLNFDEIRELIRKETPVYRLSQHNQE